MQPAVVFDHVWKKFLRGERHDSLRDLLPAMAKGLFRRAHPDELESTQEFWAVKDVSFEVNPGEALGIIGPNGAGKSTTLKLLTKILRPTRGHCHVRGRVGALIEVAAGFHPDLTGRENIFLQGAIMGMKRADIAKKLDEIIDFAGVSDFIDTPVKRYSSGMNARLGFSIAAHLDPDVLIIDEVLSVGDMSFQEKCIRRMHEFRRNGVTIVFVSHNLQAIAALCPTTLCLKGTVTAYGPTEATIGKYIEQTGISDVDATKDDVQITCGRLEHTGGQFATIVSPGQPLAFDVTYLSKIDVSDFELGFIVHRTTDGLLVYAKGVPGVEAGVAELRAGQPATVHFSFCPYLTRGHYHIECHVFHHPTQRWIGRARPAAVFNIEESKIWGGIADVQLTYTLATSKGAPELARESSSPARS